MAGEATPVVESTKIPMADQASGLRQRMNQRSGAKRQRSLPRIPLSEGAGKQRCVHTVPLIKAHIRLPGSDAMQIPPGNLIWHWRPTPRAATGWDLQARLHVCGLPQQFRADELSQWRYLCPEWHLLGESLERFEVADMVLLWLPSDKTNMPSLLPRLRRCLTWLCRNHPRIPIILTGTTAVIGRRLMRWAARAIPVDSFLALQADEAAAFAWQQRKGYYRLLQMCRDYPAQAEWQLAKH